MLASILIVSKNRKTELQRTLRILYAFIDVANHEVLVFLDGCTDGSEELKSDFHWVSWFGVTESIGASSARNQLYKHANGKIFIGLDDDAHPLTNDFISKTEGLFQQFPNVGIIAFEEIKGIFASDTEAMVVSKKEIIQYYSNDFIGCGFAILKKVYDDTNGFPVWVDIYGEESCVAIEVIANGHDILYTNAIKINHRVDLNLRKAGKLNYFRFGRQLKNTTYYFLVYHRFPMYRIAKLYYHNFVKYALTDRRCFSEFFETFFHVLVHFRKVLRYRNPVNASVLKKIQDLQSLKY